MSDAEIHRGEDSAAFSLGESLKKAGLEPTSGGWLEGALIDSKFRVEASGIFSLWLSEVTQEPDRQKPEEHLDKLIKALSPYLTKFQNSRRTHDFLERVLPKTEREKTEYDDLE